VTQPASQGLSQNEIGCVRISVMAKSMNAPLRTPTGRPLSFRRIGMPLCRTVKITK